MMRKLGLIALLALLPAVAYAHLCNDVFAQARDNLAVKVDVRDGQLRIGQEGSFRVYLLNTMDRDIAAIALEVTSEYFDGQVAPAADWRTHPVLKTANRGGKKEYFTVTLRRKSGVPDGRYRIGLRLYDPRDRRREFKTVDAAGAAGVYALPPLRAVRVDGRADRVEWAQSVLCTDFYVYKKAGKYYENERVASQARFRLAMDAQNLYALLQFQGGEGAASDVGTIYVAPGADAQPVSFSFDRVSGRLTSEHSTEGIQYVVSADKTLIECKIPRALLRPEGRQQDPPGYYVNFTRTAAVGGKSYVTYWRGNPRSVSNPIVYGYFTIGSVQRPAG